MYGIGYRKIAIIAVVLLLLGGGYWYLASKSAPGSTAGADGPASAVVLEQNTAANAEILNLLTDLRAVTLPSTIFESPSFQSFRAFEVDIPSRPKGRQNPFAPIGSGQVQAQGSATSSAIQ